MNIVYDEFMEEWKNSRINLEKDDFKVLLTHSSYIPLESHNFSNIEKYEIEENSSYKKGGQEIRFHFKGDDSNTIVVNKNCDPIVWYNLTAEIKYLIAYKEYPDFSKKLIACLDLNENSIGGFILNDDNISLSWPDDFLKIDFYVPEPEPPTKEELQSGLLNIGALNTMQLNKRIFIE